MQLFLNATSPFARVARIVALEKGLADQLDLVWSDPWNNDPALLAQHPQARIPVLVTDDGQAISESLLIAQYLDQMGHGASLVPPAQMSTILARTSVAYGLMEAAFNVVIARKYEGEAADNSVMGQRRLAAIDRVLQQWTQELMGSPMSTLTLAEITIAVALDYVRFRLPKIWETQNYSQLHSWLKQVHLHPSLLSTRFSG